MIFTVGEKISLPLLLVYVDLEKVGTYVDISTSEEVTSGAITREYVHSKINFGVEERTNLLGSVLLGVLLVRERENVFVRTRRVPKI